MSTAKRLTGKETPAEVEAMLAQKDFELTVKFLRPEGEHYKVLSLKEQMSVWALGDGFGPQMDYIFLDSTGWDWSHIRDSSPGAQYAMAQKIRDILAERAHPGHQFCAKCLDSGLHLPSL